MKSPESEASRGRGLALHLPRGCVVSNFAADGMFDDLAFEQQSWARHIELNLARLARDLDKISDADEPDDREGRLVLQQALKQGAAALAAMPGASSRAAGARPTQPD